MNTVSIGRDIYDSKSQSDAQNTRLARLQTTFDAMPDFYEEGGDGWQGFRTNAAAGLLDVINVVGFGSGGVAARAAAAGVMAKAGTHSVKNATTQAALGQGKKSWYPRWSYKRCDFGSSGWWSSRGHTQSRHTVA